MFAACRLVEWLIDTAPRPVIGSLQGLVRPSRGIDPDTVVVLLFVLPPCRLECGQQGAVKRPQHYDATRRLPQARLHFIPQLSYLRASLHSLRRFHMILRNPIGWKKILLFVYYIFSHDPVFSVGHTLLPSLKTFRDHVFGCSVLPSHSD